MRGMAIFTRAYLPWWGTYCYAGTLNTPKIKGTHTAMKSGMIAADEVYSELEKVTLILNLATLKINFFILGQELERKSKKRKTILKSWANSWNVIYRH